MPSVLRGSLNDRKKTGNKTTGTTTNLKNVIIFQIKETIQ